MPEVTHVSAAARPRTLRYFGGLAVAFAAGAALTALGLSTDAALTETVGAALASSSLVFRAVRVVRRRRPPARD